MASAVVGRASWVRTGVGTDRWFAGLVGVVAVLALWSAAGVFEWFHGTIPTPWAVVQTIVDTGWSYYVENFSATIGLALRGFFWGNLLAILLAFLVILIPPIEGLATQLAIISYCTPIIAVESEKLRERGINLITPVVCPTAKQVAGVDIAREGHALPGEVAATVKRSS